MNEIHTKNSDKSLWPVVKRQLAIAMMLLSGVVISACTDSRPPEQIVQERSQARLDALMNSNIDEALSYATPSYQKLTTPIQYFSRVQGSNQWTKALVESAECTQDACNVVVSVSYRLAALGIESTQLQFEKWIKVDGQWWLYQY